MNAIVTVEEKKQFIRWFLKRYKLKRRECVWILNYLTEHENHLQYVHFTDEAHYCPRAVVMSTTESESIPFRFYKGNLMTADAEKAFHDIRLNSEEPIWIQLNYPNKHACPQYVTVHVENKFLPEYLQTNENDRKIADEFLDHMSKTANETYLLTKIDEALDANDKELFIELTNELKNLQKEGVLVGL